jgi:hypothetical protein
MLAALLVLTASLTLVLGACAGAQRTDGKPEDRLSHRWLFVWRDMSDPAEIDRMIARFPRAQAAGYNGVVFDHPIAPEKAAELKAAAKKHGLKLVVTVMGGARDRNNMEGVLSRGARFVAHNGVATFQADNPTKVLNGDFEQAEGDKLAGWTLQDSPGETTFADHEVVHGGKTSVRMQDFAKNDGQHCRVSQPIALQPYRQYHISLWVKAEDLKSAHPEVKVLLPDFESGLSFETFRVEPTQDWRKYDLVFNSLNHTSALLYVGTWGGDRGRFWLDDLAIEEIGLVNVLRRPGTPVTVKGENGTVYEEGKDYQRIVDPNLNPWRGYHEAPSIKLTADTRIKEGERLRVSYYHSVIIYEDRVTECLSEPTVLEGWKQEVVQVNELLHPDGFMMSHDELRVMNQCALCQSRKMTPGEILADNLRKSAAIIRELRPDAEIWVWNDMFDPMHNAVPSGYYLVNGPLTDSWKDFPKDVGIMNWQGGLEGKNCQFFADLGLRQILSGYYDGDEDGAAIARWRDNTKEVPGIVGAMYTTWEDKYDAMEVWAKKAWGDREQ